MIRRRLGYYDNSHLYIVKSPKLELCIALPIFGNRVLALDQGCAVGETKATIDTNLMRRDIGHGLTTY